MIVLKIKEKKAYYLLDGVTEQGIKDISKEDILAILNLVYERDDIEFDSPEENEIVNPAEKIIYEKLYEKFVDFNNNKNTIKDDIDDKFNDVISKYGE